MNILRVFAHSRFHPIQLHMEKMYQCVELFPSLLDEVYVSNWNKALLIYEQMRQFQKEAAELRQQILLQSHTDLFFPANPRDIFELLHEQSKIAHLVQNISGILVKRQIQLPQDIAENYYGFIQACLSATFVVKKAIDNLETLLSEDQNSQSRRVFQRMLATLDVYVSEAAQIHQEIKADLEALEEGLMPVITTFLYKMFEETEAIIGKAQLVGHRTQLLLVA